MNPIVLAVIPFVLASAVILLAGMRLARYGDILAEKTGMVRTWMGLIVMAAVTSLPELITGASAIVVIDVPEVAVGELRTALAMERSAETRRWEKVFP